MKVSPTSKGRLLAAALAGAWRVEEASPAAPALSETELDAVTPLLVGSGAAALGWWKLRRTSLADSAPAHILKEVYRFQTLQNALRETQIEAIFALLRGAGIESLLIKGLAAARTYTDAAVRPYGDTDVCVHVSQFAHASEVLSGPAGKAGWVDLHAGTGEADGGVSFDELSARSVALKVGAEDVRVLAPEDHLRLVCVHLLRHGAWRPLWLCDVSAALETRPADFNWSLLAGTNQRRARWVACAVGLAHALLGARVQDTPYADAARKLPRWLVPNVLDEWETPYPSMQAPMRYRAPMRAYLRRPRGVLRDLRHRWPNPIEATVRVGGPFNGLPRWPFQLANCVTRATRFLAGAQPYEP